MYEMNPEGFSGTIPIDGAVSTARRLLGEAKAAAILGYIKDLLESGVKKLVVSAWHRSVLDILKKNLVQYGLTYMDGRTSTARKQLAVDMFLNNDKISVILGQMLPLGEGWNLVAAQNVVLAEPDWVPGKNEQLIRRIRRIGQKGTNLIGHIPIIPGTLEERIVRTAIEKDINIHKTLDERN
jgi:SNF2 family DNA or RNA helicase